MADSTDVAAEVTGNALVTIAMAVRRYKSEHGPRWIASLHTQQPLK